MMRASTAFVLLGLVLSFFSVSTSRLSDARPVADIDIDSMRFYPAVIVDAAADYDAAPPPQTTVAVYGRYELSGSVIFFDWSGVSIGFQISGTDILSVALQDEGNEYNVFVNGTLDSVLVTNSTAGSAYYLVLANLDPTATYEILLTKRTEAGFGIVGLLGVSLRSPGVLNLPASPPFNPQRRIEFLGDSITCGFGDEGTPPCNFSAATENNYLTYGALTARFFDADLHLEAWSGKGLVRNYGYPNITSPDPLPSYFNKSVANSDVASSTWNFSSWVPQAVVINLGTNDFSTQPNPPQDLFENAYLDFISTIQTVYASNDNLQIFLVCGPMISGTCCEYIQNVVNSFSSGVTYINLQNLLSSDDTGCDGHPNIQGHFKMFNATAPIIGDVMGW